MESGDVTPMITALSNTPAWVYALLIYLVWVGIKASKTSAISLKKLFIIPLVFTYLSIHTLITSFDLQVFEISTWACAIFMGTALGYFDVYRKYNQIKVDKERHLIQIPGAWLTLILILIIFASKYYFSYELAIDPALSKQTGFEFSMLAVSGVCTGLFIGRLLAYLYKYFISKHSTI